MPQTISGLGRNGPWLQNQWLRVESRTDDGTISPIALEGAFRPTERAAAAVHLTTGQKLTFERCDYDIQPHEDALGRGLRLQFRSRIARQGMGLVRDIVVYDNHPYCTTRIGVTNTGRDALGLESLHAFTTSDDVRARLRLQSPPGDWRMYRNGWQSWSPTMSLGGRDLDVQSRPAELAPEPPRSSPGQFASDDMGVLFDPATNRSMLAGVVTARDFMSQVAVDVPAKSIDGRNLCDGISLAPGDAAWSEWFLIDLVGHPNDQLERYGDALARMMDARVPATTPSGWCSWYYFYTTVTETDVVRNLRALEDWRGQLPIDTVQIDDGYQADIGDWLTVNEKFPKGMQWLASEIKAAGYTPGLWLAPFLIAETSATYAQHPDFVTRNSDGTPAIANHNWERDNYGIDGTNPDAQAWLENLFRQVCDGWGYEYVKIDFLFGAALKGNRHDPNATRVRAYRQALEAVRRGTGPDRFILGCGSLMSPSVGFFDGNRIGPDCAPFWRFLTRAERESPTTKTRTPNDHLSTETAMRNTINRWWMHNRLWANDPDCLLVRTDRTKMTLDEVRTMATVIGLSGGMTLSSDDLDKLPPDRVDLLRMMVPPLPKSAVPPDVMLTDMPEQFEVAYNREYDDVRLVGVFNFGDLTRDLTLQLPEGQWHAFELWEERYRGVVSGALTFDLVSPHAARLVAVRPATHNPKLIATDAHIGMGVLDVTGQSYNQRTRELTLDLAPVGKHQRRLWVAGGTVTAARANTGATLAFAPAGGGSTVIKVDASAPTSVCITFST